MATTRFDRFLQSDYGMNYYQPEIYTPNFELLGSMIGQLEKEKQTFSALSDLPIDYYEGIHDTQAQKLRDFVATQKDLVTQATATGDIGTYRSAIGNAMSAIKKEWMPGGTADQLAKTKKQIIEEQQRINKDVEGDPNKKYALYDLIRKTKQLSDQGIIKMGTPDIYKYEDYRKDALDVASKLHASTIEDAITYAGSLKLNLPSNVIVKIKSEGVTEERILEITDALMRSGKYDDQLKVESFSKYGYVDDLNDDQVNMHIENINQNLNESYNNTIKYIDSNFQATKKEYEKAKATKQQIKQLENKAEQDKKITAEKYNQSIVSSKEGVKLFYKNRLIDGVKEITAPLAWQKRDRDLDWHVNQNAEARARMARWEQIFSPPESPGTSANVNIVENGQQLADMHMKAESNYKLATSGLISTGNQIGITRGDQNARINAMKGLMIAQAEATKNGQSLQDYILQHKDEIALGGYTDQELINISKAAHAYTPDISNGLTNFNASKDTYDGVTSIISSNMDALKDDPRFMSKVEMLTKSFNAQTGNNYTSEEYLQAGKEGKLDNYVMEKTWGNADGAWKALENAATVTWNAIGSGIDWLTNSATASFLTASPLRKAEFNYKAKKALERPVSASTTAGAFLREATVGFAKENGIKKVVTVFENPELKELYKNYNDLLTENADAVVKTLKDPYGNPVSYSDINGNRWDGKTNVTNVNASPSTMGDFLTITTADGKVYNGQGGFNANNLQALRAAAANAISHSIKNKNLGNINNLLTMYRNTHSKVSGLGDDLNMAIPKNYPDTPVLIPTKKGYTSMNIPIAIDNKGVDINVNNQTRRIFLAKLKDGHYTIVSTDPSKFKTKNGYTSYGPVAQIPVQYSEKDRFSLSKGKLSYPTLTEAQNAMAFIVGSADGSFEGVPTGVKKTSGAQQVMLQNNSDLFPTQE